MDGELQTPPLTYKVLSVELDEQVYWTTSEYVVPDDLVHLELSQLGSCIGEVGSS